ncbi:MAG: CPBP family intramembrane metalloprotease [Simkaniaceae bacterium]|nr:CPBP family intramembrane metalloprotease [Candidatus Sacchlamyda saccharinae]
MVIFIGPVVEEVFYRYLIQNKLCSFLEQKFEHLQSRSFKIISTNIFFAVSHLNLYQGIRISLFPHEAIVYEVTGSLKAAILAHVVHNFSATLALEIAGVCG